MNYRDSSYSATSAFSEPAGSATFLPEGETTIAHWPAAEFATHVLKAPAQDPHVLRHNGLYYYCESDAKGIFVRAAADFLALGSATRTLVWAPPRRGPASRNVWAPELQLIDGRCYIYFAADDGKNENHRMWVLAAASADPAGAYQLAGCLETDGWAIDGTVLTDACGHRYFVWSGWPGSRNVQQNLYIARMKNAVELAGPRVLLASPDQPWECKGLPICEGPQILQRAGRTFIVYSASGSWTEDYCLALLAHDGGDFMDPATWRKAGPVFSKNQHAWGVGHCGFVDADDGRSWIMYHAKTSRRPGWKDREVRAQPFNWNVDGAPVFEQPLPMRAKSPRTKRAALRRPRFQQPVFTLVGFSA